MKSEWLRVICGVSGDLTKTKCTAGGCQECRVVTVVVKPEYGLSGNSGKSYPITGNEYMHG